MNTLHNFGLSQYPSSSGSGANGQQQHQQQQQQLQQQQQPGGTNSLQLPISSAAVAQGMPSFHLNASSSVSPVPNPSEFPYTPQQLIVSPTTPTTGLCYGDAYTLSASATPMAASSHNTPLQQPKQPHHLGLVNTPLYHSYSYQPASQATTPFQQQPTQKQQQQQQQLPSIMLSGNTIAPISSSYQLDSFQQAVGPGPSSAAANTTQSKPRAPRNKSKFKRFRNAFIYFVNDQRNKVDEETKKLKNREFLQLMSSRWKKMPEEERRPYIDMAEEDKKRFENDVKKYGKYESRQRRYTKGRSHGKAAETAGHHGTTPYSVPDSANAASAYTSASSTVTANSINNSLMYQQSGGGVDGVGSIGYGVMNSTQTGANMPISPFYANLSPIPSSAAMAAAATASANWPGGMRYVDLASGNAAAGFQQQPHQANSLLSPANTMMQRNSNSSMESANDINDIQASLTPDYQWSRVNNAQQAAYAGLSGAVSDLTAVSAAQANANAAVYYNGDGYQQMPQQQQQHQQTA
ncbi:hypothetical protein LPJ64_003432 [Coemansia asiatica]|uniref:HMG box domain-containing protein n=1 Tax=Coemansia asiatica TaxID=1052880 RepID=A0A9W7XKB4_9FUNG|nr:hypothetical protein LPJ64_003432 [Coemansia asiatica]